MKVEVDRLAWVRIDKLGPALSASIKKKLIVLPKKSGYGSQKLADKALKFYEIVEDTDGVSWLGVPRHFFLTNMIRPYDDKTKYPTEGVFPSFVGELYTGQSRACAEMLGKLKGEPDACFGGLLQAKCGCGKTIAALYITAQLKTRTIVLLHKTNLMDQWERAINRFLPGAHVKRLQANNPDVEDANIILAMFQTINSRFDACDEAGLFDWAGLVILDECHHVPSFTFERATRQFSARYRLGLTATPKRSDGLDCILNWTVGPKLTVMTGAVVTGRWIQIKWKSRYADTPFLLPDGTINKAKVITTLSKEEKRNNYIVGQICRAAATGRKILVLTDRIAHVDCLYETLCKRLPSVSRYTGKIRKEGKADPTKAQVIVATYPMFSEGVDVPALDTLFFATPRGNVEQMVGRIQRVCAGKSEPMVVDIVDNVAHCPGQARYRRMTYRKLEFDEVYCG